MLPGTRRSMTKISIDIPNSVSTISRKRRVEVGAHRSSPYAAAGRLAYLSSQTSSKRQPL